MFVINPLYLLILVPAVLAWYAQYRVRAAYDRHARLPNRHGLTGAEIAERLLAHYRLEDVTVDQAPGYLTDHYDPDGKALHLSDGIAGSRSVTSLGIVAHEVLHAVQDAEGYRLMRLRARLGHLLAPVARWSSFLFLGGLLFGIPLAMILSGAVLVGSVILTLVTLPVERNASRRALEAIRETGLADDVELAGARQVLYAAAFTYLAGLGQRMAQLAFYGLVILAALGVWQR
jgi:uncharacterized protein